MNELRSDISELQNELKRQIKSKEVIVKLIERKNKLLRSKIRALMIKIKTTEEEKADMLKQLDVCREDQTKMQELLFDYKKKKSDMQSELLDCQTELDAHSKHLRAVEAEYRRQEKLLLENIETEKERYNDLLDRNAEHVKALEDQITELETENRKITTFNDRLREIFRKYESSMESSLRDQIHSCVERVY